MKVIPRPRWGYVPLTGMIFFLLLSIHVSCSDRDDDVTTDDSADPPAETGAIADFVYQLTNYPDGQLDELSKAPQDLAVIDLSSDGGEHYFTLEEIATLKKSGKKVLAYFSMGTNETYRPEYEAVVKAGLQLNHWEDWPDEYFVKYWEPAWWELVVKGRVDQSIAAGFDGVYLDIPNAYEEIDLDLAPGEDRESLAKKMVHKLYISVNTLRENHPGSGYFPRIPRSFDNMRGIRRL